MFGDGPAHANSSSRSVIEQPAGRGSRRRAFITWSAKQLSRDAVWDVLGIVYITGALLVYGVLQERIMTIGFGPGLELFDNSIFLVLCNRLVTCLVAFAYIAFTGHDVKPAAPLMSYSAVSFTNVVATSCQYEALRYVSFAIQTLAKSAKTLPVMLWGTLVAGKMYKSTDYLQAVAITVGCTVFVMGGEAASRIVVDKTDHTAYMLGGGLMLLYLAVDGLTSTWQDTLFTTYNMAIADQVLYTTGFSTLLSFVGAVGAGQLYPSLLFVLRNPDALYYILALSLCSALVQLIISYTIKRYGAVVFATIMTTRQLCSILASSIVFMNPLLPKQWLGLVVVFGALYWKLMARGMSGAGRAMKAGLSPPPTVKTVAGAHNSSNSNSGNLMERGTVGLRGGILGNIGNGSSGHLASLGSSGHLTALSHLSDGGRERRGSTGSGAAAAAAAAAAASAHSTAVNPALPGYKNLQHVLVHPVHDKH